jgi:hypothetical protein
VSFTFLYGVLDTERRQFHFVGAGNRGPVVLRRDDVAILATEMGPR